MKVLNLVLENKMIQIGESGQDPNSAIWYYMSDAVYNWLSNSKYPYKVGDEVTIQSDFNNGQYILTRINKVKKEYRGSRGGQTSYQNRPAQGQYNPPTGGNNLPPAKQYTNNYTGKNTPIVQDSINRQNTLNAVAVSLQALAGQLDPNNICEVSTTLYNHYKALKETDGKI